MSRHRAFRNRAYSYDEDYDDYDDYDEEEYEHEEASQYLHPSSRCVRAPFGYVLKTCYQPPSLTHTIILSFTLHYTGPSSISSTSTRRRSRPPPSPPISTPPR